MKAEPSTAIDVPAGVRSAVDAILDRKGLDLKVLYVGEVCDFTDFFLVASGTSDRQVQAMADAVQERLKAEGERPLHVEGEQQAKWVLLDYGDFLVHLFDAERREFYRLERLWSDAPRLSLPGMTEDGGRDGSEEDIEGGTAERGRAEADAR
jgi:ribosome-associated protein